MGQHATSGVDPDGPMSLVVREFAFGVYMTAKGFRPGAVGEDATIPAAA